MAQLNIKFCKFFLYKAKVYIKYADKYIKKRDNKQRYQEMGINITHTMNGYQHENRGNHGNTDILNRKEISEESAENTSTSSIFNSDSRIYSNAQLSILKASSQISISSTLKETLNYLKKHTVKKQVNTPVFGELWDILSDNKDTSIDIIELDIDYSAKNIFEAA